MSKSQLEQELKFRIADVRQFQRLLEVLGPVEEVLCQENHYFTASGTESSSGWTLRLRSWGAQGGQNLSFEFTLKRGRRFRSGYLEADELTSPLSSEEARGWLEGVLPASSDWVLAPLVALREELGVEALRRLGSTRNLRHRCWARSWGAPELDRTEFPDGSVDYELEIETSAPELARQDLEQLGVLRDLELQHQTKYRRFLQRLEITRQIRGEDSSSSSR